MQICTCTIDSYIFIMYIYTVYADMYYRLVYIYNVYIQYIYADIYYILVYIYNVYRRNF